MCREGVDINYCYYTNYTYYCNYAIKIIAIIRISDIIAIIFIWSLLRAKVVYGYRYCP